MPKVLSHSRVLLAPSLFDPALRYGIFKEGSPASNLGQAHSCGDVAVGHPRWNYCHSYH